MSVKQTSRNQRIMRNKTQKRRVTVAKLTNNDKMVDSDSEPIYSKEEFNSNNGMLTTVWGPSMWHYLHTMSFNYPVEPTKADRQHYREFILLLQYVLPCGKCRKNLVKNFKRLPLMAKDLESRETFSKYIYNLHEVVNKMLGKKSGLTYDEVRIRYEHFRARCAKTAPTKQDLKGILKPTQKIQQTRKKREKEGGCTEPIYGGKKSKCVLQIVPHDRKCPSFQMSKECEKIKVDVAV